MGRRRSTVLIKDIRMKNDAERVLSRLNDLLLYDANSGNFIRKTSRGPAKAGRVAGTVTKYGYRIVTVDGQKYCAHRLVWLLHTGVWPSGDIDHIDGDKLNNRINNLRDVSRSVNQQNRNKILSNNTTGLLGVSYHKRAKSYRATIGLNKKSINLGHYRTAEEAHAAYMAAKQKLHEGYVP